MASLICFSFTHLILKIISFNFLRVIAFLRQVRYIFRAETLAGQGLPVPHQSRKRYIFSPLWANFKTCIQCSRVASLPKSSKAS